MFDRDEYTGMFIGLICCVSFFAIMWITFPMAAEWDKQAQKGVECVNTI